MHIFNTWGPKHNGRHFPDEFFKCIFLNENAWISIKVPLKFVPKGSIINIPALVQLMAWRRSGDKPLSLSRDWAALDHDSTLSQPVIRRSKWSVSPACHNRVTWLATSAQHLTSLAVVGNTITTAVTSQCYIMVMSHSKHDEFLKSLVGHVQPHQNHR